MKRFRLVEDKNTEITFTSDVVKALMKFATQDIDIDDLVNLTKKCDHDMCLAIIAVIKDVLGAEEYYREVEGCLLDSREARRSFLDFRSPMRADATSCYLANMWRGDYYDGPRLGYLMIKDWLVHNNWVNDGELYFPSEEDMEEINQQLEEW